MILTILLTCILIFCYLGFILAHNTKLTDINLSYCCIDGEATAHLAEALTNNLDLQKLWLRGNPTGEAGAKALALMLQYNKGLNTLDMTGCISIGGTGVKKIIKCILQNTSLKFLQLPNKLQSAASCIEGYNEVQDIIQWTSDISSQGVVEFIEEKTLDTTFLGKLTTELTIIL